MTLLTKPVSECDGPVLCEKLNDVMTVICICVMNKCNAINIQLHAFVVLVTGLFSVQ